MEREGYLTVDFHRTPSAVTRVSIARVFNLTTYSRCETFVLENYNRK